MCESRVQTACTFAQTSLEWGAYNQACQGRIVGLRVACTGISCPTAHCGAVNTGHPRRRAPPAVGDACITPLAPDPVLKLCTSLQPPVVSLPLRGWRWCCPARGARTYVLTPRPRSHV